VLEEFLDTFDVHHSFYEGKRNPNVSLDEFIEYYENVSATIEND